MKTMTQHWRRNSGRAARQGGLGVIVALLVLVVLSTLAAAMVRMNWGQQMSSAQDLQGAQASQAASAGVEWGLYKVLRAAGGWTNCVNQSQTLDLSTQTGFWVTVSCSSTATAYREGGKADGVTARAVRVYTVNAVACNSSAGCPDNTKSTSATYVERQRQVTATDIDTAQE